MKIALMNPKEGWLIVKMHSSEQQTESGLVTTENDDEFVLYGEVVKGAVNLGEHVLFHALDAQTFFALDQLEKSERFAFVKETAILGTYGISA